MSPDGEVSPEIPVWFTPAQLAVGANLMALGLALMVQNEREGRRIMESLNEPHIALIAIDATKRMSAAMQGPYSEESDVATDE